MLLGFNKCLIFNALYFSERQQKVERLGILAKIGVKKPPCGSARKKC